jgi:hypothetical protein
MLSTGGTSSGVDRLTRMHALHGSRGWNGGCVCVFRNAHLHSYRDRPTHRRRHGQRGQRHATCVYVLERARLNSGAVEQLTARSSSVLCTQRFHATEDETIDIAHAVHTARHPHIPYLRLPSPSQTLASLHASLMDPCLTNLTFSFCSALRWVQCGICIHVPWGQITVCAWLETTQSAHVAGK